jgi:nicotinate phosphoribosyltransferase
MVEAKKVED